MTPEQFLQFTPWRGTFVAMFANSFFTRQSRELEPTSSVDSLSEIRQGGHKVRIHLGTDLVTSCLSIVLISRVFS